MTEKKCANCGEINPSASNFCFSCGSNEFRDVPPGLAARLGDATAQVPDPAVRITEGRVIVLSVLSVGFYILY